MRQTHASCQRFFDRAIGTTKVRPAEVMADKAAVYSRVLDERVPAARHRTDRYGNNRIEADHAQLKRRLRPMRGLKTDASARVFTAGHAFVQNLRGGAPTAPAAAETAWRLPMVIPPYAAGTYPPLAAARFRE